jgi:hypothetical protein
MDHIINAKYGDKIIINIPAKPQPVKQQVIFIKPNSPITEEHYNTINDICTATDYTLDELKSKSKKQKIIAVRFYLINQLRNQKLSLKNIGRLLNRDHTSVRNAIIKYNALASVQDEILNNTIAKIQQYEADKNKD